MTTKLPANRRQWEKAALEEGVLHAKIHDLSILDPASKIKDAQFYALRILWQVHDKNPTNLKLYDQEIFTEAQASLKQNQSWLAYLADIEDNIGNPSLGTIGDTGTFSLVRYNQMRASLSPRTQSSSHLGHEDVLSAQLKIVPSPSPIATRLRSRQPTSAPSGSVQTPRRTLFQNEREPLNMTSFQTPIRGIESIDLDDTPQGSEMPPTPQSPANAASTLPAEDEQIVNTALILLLDGLTIHHPKIKAGGNRSARWTMKRLQLKFGTWEARTDGFLRVADSDVRAILETKPYVRDQSEAAIQKQEGAQMAAWIHQHPNGGLRDSMEEDSCFRRLLISQDCTEIYLTVAEYDSAYRDYLDDDTQSTGDELSFLTMHRYGPWDTRAPSHMKYLGPILLAFTLAQCMEDHVRTK